MLSYRSREKLFNGFYLVSGMVWGGLSCLTWVLPPTWRHRFIIQWPRLIVWWAKVSLGINHQVRGLEHFKNAKQPVVILSKHQSTWETLYLQNAFFPACTVLKKELIRIPFFGWGLAALRPIPIDRSQPTQALKKVKTLGLARVNSGLNLLLFPEGTRVKVGEKNKYARSGVDIAIKSGAAIIPVAHNAGQCWPWDNQNRQPGMISVVVGEPISSEGRKSKELLEEVENWIESQSNALIQSK